MAYSKQTWTDGVSLVDAARMGHIEDGIGAAHAELEGRLSDASLNDAYAWPALTGETGVLDVKYPPGDVRRYGITPDGVTDWYADHRAKWDAAQAASADLGATIYFPAGYYASGYEVTRSNVTVEHAEGAEFGGLLHFISYDPDPVANPIENIRVKGTVVTYDRVGTTNVRNITFDSVVVKDNGALNTSTPGATRGVHFYAGTYNLRARDILIEGLTATGSNNIAALEIDGGAERCAIDSVHVLDSGLHGAYITGPGHSIGSLRVDAYGSGTWPGGIIPEANDVIQSGQLKGVWLNRCYDGWIGRITVNQTAGRANARYDVLVEETGHWVGGVFLSGKFTIDHIEVLNLTDSSRGLSFGDTAYGAGDVVVDCNTIRVNAATGTARTAGAGAVSLNEKAVLSVGAVVFDVDTVDALFLKDSTARIAARSIDLGVHKYRGIYSAGKVFVDEVRSYRTSSGGGVSTVEFLAGSEFSRIGALLCDGNATHPASGLHFNTVADVRVDQATCKASDTGSGAVKVISSPRAHLGRISLTGDGPGVGLALTDSTDAYVGPGTVTGYATGVTSTGTVSGAAVGVKVSGNTTNTNVPAATFSTLGCSNFQL